MRSISWGVLAALTLATAAAGAEEPPPSNVVDVELGGPGVYDSIGYERSLVPGLGVRLGVGGFSVDRMHPAGVDTGGNGSTKLHILTLPLGLRWLALRDGPHALEAGAAVTAVWSSSSGEGYVIQPSDRGVAPLGCASVGYRYQSLPSGVVIRLGADLLYARDVGDRHGAHLLPWFHVGVGGGF